MFWQLAIDCHAWILVKPIKYATLFFEFLAIVCYNGIREPNRVWLHWAKWME
jgi:hypothetical protein